MKALNRWIFWIVSGLVFVGACLFGYVVFSQYTKLQGTYSKVRKAQKNVSKYSNDEFPTEKTLELSNLLLEKWKGDLKKIVLANYKRERSVTKFELFFSPFGFTDDPTAIDLNKYRSIYETSRDDVLARVKNDGKIEFSEKASTGFQVFEKNAVLSLDTLPLIQKKFWIASAIYDCLIAYNNDPTIISGWEYVDGEGDKKVDTKALITSMHRLLHGGKKSPPDLSSDDSKYDDTRDVMRPFYYYEYWKARVEFSAPSVAVPGIIRVLQNHPLFFKVDGVSIQREKKGGDDRYSSPQSHIVLDLLVCDFNEKLFARFLPGYKGELDDSQDDFPIKEEGK